MIRINDLVDIAKKAGNAILEIYSKDFSVEYKDDKSPLTEADKKSNQIIVSELQKLYPEIPILSEESKEIPYNVRKEWKKFWLIDPLDGTKEFIKKNGEFTVNISLIEDNIPVLGVVYVPVKEIVYYGDQNGSFKSTNGVSEILRHIINPNDKLRVVASRSHFNDETKNYIEHLGKDYELVNAGSSIKLCLVAERKADIYPRLGPTMEWDTAAAHAVCRFAGRKVLEFGTNSELRYNKENLLNPFFVVK